MFRKTRAIINKHIKIVVGVVVAVLLIVFIMGPLRTAFTGVVGAARSTKEEITLFNDMMRRGGDSPRSESAPSSPESSSSKEHEEGSSSSSRPSGNSPSFLDGSFEYNEENDESEGVKVGSGEVGAEVHFIAVGNADAILIKSDGEYMLIDAGEAVVGDVVVDYLMDMGVNRLELVVATHPHSDHIGGIPAVIEAFDVEKMMMPDVVNSTRAFSDLIEAIEDYEIDVEVPRLGDRFSLGGSTFTVYGPSKEHENLNDNSIVLRMEYGTTSFLFTGDIEEEAESYLVGLAALPKTNVLKVPHHGSSGSSSNDFIRKISPRYAVFTCGEVMGFDDTDYGHPHSATLSRYKVYSTLNRLDIFRTDTQGHVVAYSDGTDIEFETQFAFEAAA